MNTAPPSDPAVDAAELGSETFADRVVRHFRSGYGLRCGKGAETLATTGTTRRAIALIADWLVVSGGLAVAYNHPVDDDGLTARVVTIGPTIMHLVGLEHWHTSQARQADFLRMLPSPPVSISR